MHLVPTRPRTTRLRRHHRVALCRTPLNSAHITDPRPGKNPMTHFINPILNADWSDPDAIRVGDEYFMTASTFNRSPGLPVLRSNDLVTWEIIGHALTRLTPDDHFALPRHGCGVWAPALRHHDGRFYIVYGDPDHGIFVLSAENPAGPWTEPHVLYAASGVIDPGPFWDDDGRAYIVHRWESGR